MREYMFILKDFFVNFSALDVAKSLFILNMRLPNIATTVKMSVLYAAFLSIDSTKFSEENRVNDYEDFNFFCEQLFKIAPNFSSLDDFIPVPDRGDVKVYLNDNYYNMLYGSEIDNTYDWVEAYKLIYGKISKDFIEGDPIIELEDVLRYETYLIQNLSSTSPKVEHISPWYREIPSKNFFKESSLFLDKDFVWKIESKYLIELSSLNYSSANDVVNDIFANMFLDKLFLVISWKKIPIMPRRFLIVLIQYRSKILKSKLKDLEFWQKSTKKLIINLANFMKDRHNYWSIIGPCVSMNPSSKTAVWTDFFALTSSKDKIFVFYVIPFSYFSVSEGIMEKQIELLNNSLSSINSNGFFYEYTTDNGIQISNISDKKVIPIWIIPNFTLEAYALGQDKKLPWHLWSLIDFITIIDEDDNINMLCDFFDWEDENNFFSISSISDRFFAYKSSHTVPFQWAIEPDMMVFDHSIWTNYRYEQMSKFWKIYPKKDILWLPSYFWKLDIVKGKMCLFLSKTDRKVLVEVVKIGNSSIILYSPFGWKIIPKDEYLKCYETIATCLSYYFQKYSLILNNTLFAWKEIIVQINIYCKQHIEENTDFNHVKCTDAYWVNKWIYKMNTYRINFCFDYDYCLEQFGKKVNDGELYLFRLILSNLSELFGDEIPTKLNKKLHQLEWNKPGFYIYVEKNIPFSFPLYSDPMIPQSKHYLKAKREISKILLKNNIVYGNYDLEGGKKIINTIKLHIYDYLKQFIAKFSFQKSISFLLSRIDSLLYKNWVDNKQFFSTVDRFVDYDPIEDFGIIENDFLQNIKNYRYCLEVFVSLNNNQWISLKKDDFQFIIALIDRLLVFQSASDSLHYQMFAASIDIKKDLSFNINYVEDIELLEKQYKELEYKIELWEIGDNSLKVSLQEEIEQKYLDNLDISFNEDLWFSFDEMIKVLKILSLWGALMKKSDIWEYNTFSLESILIKILEIDPSIKQSHIEKVIDFLTFKSEDVLKIYNPQTNQIETCDDIPVWEHSKRFSRYLLKPIIRFSDTLYRWSVTCKKTIDLWYGSLLKWKMPVFYRLDKTQKVCEKYKAILDKALETFVYEKLKEIFPQTVVKNFDFIKRDPLFSHKDVGDYDVICYNGDDNILWILECKEMLPPYSFKESKKTRDAVFNTYLPKIIRRQKYLQQNISVFEKLNKRKFKTTPQIKSIYISSYNYWRTQDFANKTGIEFITLKLLYDKLDPRN